MSVYSISDLHLACDETKKMDVFGSGWQNHFDKIRNDWISKVGEDDIVLLPGDLSWAMQIGDAVPHIEAVCALPGKKVFLRGNHDYWWSSVTQVREKLKNGAFAVQNDCKVIGEYVICGTRGWLLETDRFFKSDTDLPVLKRELIRLGLSLESAVKHIASGKKLVVMMHFPPVYPNLKDTCFSEILENYPVENVVFGHLHGETVPDDFSFFEKSGIKYQLVSCDFLNFKLKQIV